MSKVDEIEVPFVENIFEGDEENLMLKNFIDTNIRKEEEKIEIEDFMPVIDSKIIIYLILKILIK